MFMNLISTLNLNAVGYIILNDCIQLHLPNQHFLNIFLINELKAMISDIPAEIDILKFSCHSQIVDCSVKLGTEVSAVVRGNNARGGFITSYHLELQCSNLKSKVKISIFYETINLNVERVKIGEWWNSICSHL